MPSSPLLIAIAWIVLTVPAGLILWRMMSRRRERDQAALAGGLRPDESGMTEVPVRGIATRGGFLRGAYTQNSLNPRFGIGPDAVQMRILKAWRLPFVELTQIDARKTLGGMALIFHIQADNRVFIARFGDAALARSALALLPPSIPLTEDAAVLRDGHAGAATRGLPRYEGRLG